MFTPTIAVILGLLIYIAIGLFPKPWGKLFSLFYIFIFFLFTRVHVSETQGGFYTAMILFIFIAELYEFGIEEVDRFKFAGFSFKGIAFALLSLAIGAIIFFFMRFLGGAEPGAVIGVPTLLQISPGAAIALSAAGIGLLGIAENRFLISLIKILKKMFLVAPIPFLKTIPFLIITLPFVLGALILSIFHGTILIGGVGFLIFAFIIFLIWGIMAFVGFENAAEYSHYFWNTTLTLSRFQILG